MKKSLLFLGTLLVTSAVTTTITACNNPTLTTKSLKDVLTITNLGEIAQENPGEVPKASELKTKLFTLNHELDVKSINIIDITNNNAVVVGDGIFYKKDSISITYQAATIDIRTKIIDKSYIGHIATGGELPTITDIITRIEENYPDLEINHLLIDNITNQTAIIKGDDILYSHQVTVKFSTNGSVDLSVIIKPDLTVKTIGKDTPLNDDVLTALKNIYQKKLNSDVIAIDIINATIAIITSTNQEIYTGRVIVNLHLDISIALQDVINHGLNKIAIRSKTITVDDVKHALTKQYPMLKINEVEVTLQDNNAVIKSCNQKIYTGPDVIVNNLLIDLNSVLTNKLPTFEIPGKNQPSESQIMTVLKATNINLDVTKIIITNITDNSADISGDGIFYSKDNLVVTYNCDKAELLNDVLKQSDLGTINTNGLTTPSESQIMTTLKVTNINLDVTKIIITNITDNSADISGDGTTYKGMVIVSFVINGTTININDLSFNHSETNSVGSLKTTWTSPDITLLSNWRDYASDWDSFTDKFNTLSFGDQSYFHVYCNRYTDKKLSGSQLNVATNGISGDRNKNTLQLNFYYDGGFWGAFLQLDGYIHIWHDQQNVYISINWSIDTIKCFSDRVWDINLQGATLVND